jgi:hypothetical protein
MAEFIRRVGDMTLWKTNREIVIYSYSLPSRIATTTHFVLLAPFHLSHLEQGIEEDAMQVYLSDKEGTKGWGNGWLLTHDPERAINQVENKEHGIYELYEKYPNFTLAGVRYV